MFSSILLIAEKGLIFHKDLSEQSRGTTRSTPPRQYTKLQCPPSDNAALHTSRGASIPSGGGPLGINMSVHSARRAQTLPGCIVMHVNQHLEEPTLVQKRIFNFLPLSVPS